MESPDVHLHTWERDVRDGIIYSPVHFCPFVLEQLALEVAFLVCAAFLLVWEPVLVAFSMSLLKPKPKSGRTVLSRREDRHSEGGCVPLPMGAALLSEEAVVE